MDYLEQHVASFKIAWPCTRKLQQVSRFYNHANLNIVSHSSFVSLCVLFWFPVNMPYTRGRLQFRTGAVLTVMLPLLGFITCVTWSLIFDFKSSTATHCGVSIFTFNFWCLFPHFNSYFLQVHNYLPSVSAAIGDYVPQRYIWRTVIALHTVPRIQIAFVYYVYFISILAKWYEKPVLINSALNLVEIFSLFGLTFISSTDNYSKTHWFILKIFLRTLEVINLTCCSNS